jgi:hypothetical protein
MPRHRKKHAPAADLAPVLVVCRDPHHHDEDGYAERGYHLVGELRHAPDSPGGMEWSGPGPEKGPFRRSGIAIAAGPVPGAPPFKRHVGDDGQVAWRFRCSCPRDAQRSEADLAAIIAAWMREFPGRLCEIDLCRLERK